jgi:hypothetical protein
MNRADVNKIQGADYHPAFQQIAFVDRETGELNELRLGHREEAEKLERQPKQKRPRRLSRGTLVKQLPPEPVHLYCSPV